MLWTLPAILLLVVVVHQRWRVRSVHQSAWKGGGFGMFSDIDQSSIAAVLWIADDGQLTPLRLESCGSTARASRIPTPENILNWGRSIVAARWQRCGDTAHLLTVRRGAEAVSVVEVTLHRLRIDFDGCEGVYSSSEEGVFTVTAAESR